MALVTSPRTIPDLAYEYHTITIDSIGQDSANTFTCHLNQPLKNVVQARLLGARINSNVSTEHCYISIQELDSIFSDRTSNVYDGQGSLSTLRNSFASLIKTEDTVINFTDNYPVITQYINPIRRIDRFNVTIRDQSGNPIVPSTPVKDNFLVIRFVCRKPNL
jgi:hypothetical protein